ncbi:hypothetical protein ACHAWF_007983, partial [Thalassiosira exigua]
QLLWEESCSFENGARPPPAAQLPRYSANRYSSRYSSRYSIDLNFRHAHVNELSERLLRRLHGPSVFEQTTMPHCNHEPLRAHGVRPHVRGLPLVQLRQVHGRVRDGLISRIRNLVLSGLVRSIRERRGLHHRPDVPRVSRLGRPGRELEGRTGLRRPLLHLRPRRRRGQVRHGVLLRSDEADDFRERADGPAVPAPRAVQGVEPAVLGRQGVQGQRAHGVRGFGLSRHVQPRRGGAAHDKRHGVLGCSGGRCVLRA